MRKDHTYHKQPLSGASITWEKSKEEIWAGLSEKIAEQGPGHKSQALKLQGRKWPSLAASVTLLLALTGFMRFHTVKTQSPADEISSVVLPDGSIVELNSSSTLSYHPHWWRLARSVRLEGEAWFEVEKGSRFRVESSLALTEVLGTSFNVFARGDSYRVSCHSGRVQVSSRQTKDSAILDPGSKAVLDDAGTLAVSPMKYKGDTPAWLNPMIIFTSTPLHLVFEEIERQYGIEIEYSGVPEHIYSGNFAVDTPLENVLSLLCRPFNLSYELSTGKKYIIVPAPAD
jgi:ferric-dicitrate binding protein FerR (iron transport regulator)